MPTLELFLLFLLADFFLKISPGPDMAQVIGRGMTQGWKPAWECVLGVGAAGFVQVPAAAFGIAAIFSSSEILFQIVKMAGVLYLIYLGVSAIRRALTTHPSVDLYNSPNSGGHDAFIQGFLTNILNPKVFVFMIAFLPQFAQPINGPVWSQMLLLGTIMKFNGVIFLGLCAFMASRVRHWVMRNRWFLRAQEGVLGFLMLALAAYIFFTTNTPSSARN